MTIGLVGAGQMGSALGAALRSGGHRVLTTLAGRSSRTVRLVRDAQLLVVASLADLLAAVDVLLVVTPPDAAVPVAHDLARATRDRADLLGLPGPVRDRGRPLVVDLNAIAPSTVEHVAMVLAQAGLELVDGSISGPPPTIRPGARIYLSGPRAAEVAGLHWQTVHPILLDGRVGTASAVKMCTASVYKGVTGVLTQAVRAALRYGVVGPVLADLAEAGYQPLPQVAVAATKAWRFVPEMREIANTQHAAGLPVALFEAMAVVYEQLAGTALAQGDPESVDPGRAAHDVLALLKPA